MNEIQIPRHNKQQIWEKTVRKQEWVCVGGAGRRWAFGQGLKAAVSGGERDNQIKFCSFPCPLCSLRTIIASLLASQFYGNHHWGWCPQEKYQSNTEAGLGIGVDENMCYLPALVFCPFTPSLPKPQNQWITLQGNDFLLIPEHLEISNCWSDGGK